MNNKDFNDFIVDQRINLIRSVLSAKSAEYATGNQNVFEAFEKGILLSTTKKRETYAWELLVKHLVSIKDIINANENDKVISEELINEKIGDAINYLILLEGMLKERKMNEGNINKIKYTLKEDSK